MILNVTIMLIQKYIGALVIMKKLPDESRMAKKSDLKKMEKKILEKDRKEDNKMYVKKSVKRK